MKKVLLAGIAALTVAGSTAVYAQHRPWFHSHTRMSPEDRAAFLDARIAAVHAGLKLTRRSGEAVAAGGRPRCATSPRCGWIAPMRGWPPRRPMATRLDEAG